MAIRVRVSLEQHCDGGSAANIIVQLCEVLLKSVANRPHLRHVTMLARIMHQCGLLDWVCGLNLTGYVVAISLNRVHGLDRT